MRARLALLISGLGGLGCRGRGAEDSVDTGLLETFRCTEPAGESPEAQELERGSRLHVARVGDAVALVISPPSDAPLAWRRGAPVVVTAPPALGSPVGDLHPSFLGDDGVVELLVVYPGWTVGETSAPGVADQGGPGSAAAVATILAFAQGQLQSNDGYDLATLVGRPVCDGAVVALANSSGGAPLTGALAGNHGLDDLAGVAYYESPPSAGWSLLQGGALWMDPDGSVDADGDGFPWDDGRDRLFALNTCEFESCPVDPDLLAWDPDTNATGIWSAAGGDLWPDGVLYLDRDGDGALTLGPSGTPDADESGAIEADEDWLLLARRLADETRAVLVYEPEVTALAAQGPLAEADWPETLADVEESEEFWDTRSAVTQVPGAAAALGDRPVALLYTAVDHAVAVPGAPHIALFDMAWASTRLQVRYNTSLEAARCFASPEALEGWEGGPEPGAQVIPEDLWRYAFPEEDDPRARVAGALGVLWDRAPFDHCPAD